MCFWAVSSSLIVFLMPIQVSESENSLRSEGVPIWEKTVADLMEGTVVLYTGSNESEGIFTATQGSCVYVVDRVLESSQSLVAFVANDRYEFWLEKSPSDAPIWKIRDIQKLNRDAKDKLTSTVSKVTNGARIATCHRPYSLFFQGFLSLDQVVNDPRFSITGIKPTVIRDQPCIEYEWEFESNHTNAIPDFPESGKFWTKPSDNWRVVRIEWKAEVTNESPLTGEVDFRNFEEFRSSAIPRVVSYRSSQDGNTVTEGQDSVTLLSELDQSIFYLPHFGLPEPPEFKSGWPIPFWLTGIGVAGVLVLIATMVRRSINKGRN